MLIYDKKFNEVERFEPNGNNNNNFSYNYKLLDLLLKNKFYDLIPNCKFISPNDFLPKISFQQFESILKKKNTKLVILLASVLHGLFGILKIELNILIFLEIFLF